jgi:hypothetical protein
MFRIRPGNSFSLLILFFPIIAFSQSRNGDSTFRTYKNETYKIVGVYGSVNAGRYVSGDLGLAYGKTTLGFEVWTLSAVGAHAEFIDPWKKEYGFGCEAWFSAYISAGFALMDYTNFSAHTYCARPMLGFGWGPVSITWGYNIRLAPSGYDKYSRNMVSIKWLLSLNHKFFNE